MCKYINKTAIPWILYCLATLSYIFFNLLEFPFFGLSNFQITSLAVLLIAVSIFVSLSTIVSPKAAFSYILYWLLIGISLEFFALSTGQFTHNEGRKTLIGAVPIMVTFNWLIIFFALYSLSTFFAFFIKKEENRLFFLIKKLLVDGLFLVLLMLLIEPIGSHSGYWTWQIKNPILLICGIIPVEIYLEYFVGMLFIMLPIRWWETFKSAPISMPYLKKVSYPLYFGWSLFAATTYWAFRKEIDEVGYLGILLLFSLTAGILRQRHRQKPN